MKNILWVVNVPLPEASILFDIPYQPYGGWLIQLANKLSIDKNYKLHVAFPSYTIENSSKNGESIIFHSVKNYRFFNQKKKEENWKQLIDLVQPDLVNIFGTEYEHSSIVSKICSKRSIDMVLTIQGIPSYIAKHFRASLPGHVYYGLTLRNLILRDSVYLTMKKFVKTGVAEQETMRVSKNVIGRTEWDKACVKNISSELHYYHAGEVLRESFYTSKKWDPNQIEKHSIFFGQGSYSIKGLHFIINQMPKILEKYPNSKLYIAGNDITDFSSKKKILLRHYYHKYIAKLIRKKNLDDNVIFTGPLNENAMRERYLKSHVFLCASSIENSPNSIGEAQILGVPVIASYVGGIPDMVSNGVSGLLYQADADYLIPSKIEEIFEDISFAQEISKNSIRIAEHRHDLELIVSTQKKIYEEILSHEN